MTATSTTSTREALSRAWTEAAARWDAARCAEWHHGKVSAIGEAARACADARRAYYAALTDA